MRSKAKYKRPAHISVFKGETWTAFKPGEDARFPDNWVSRDRYGNMCSVLNSRKDLTANAKMNQVELVWRH